MKKKKNFSQNSDRPKNKTLKGAMFKKTSPKKKKKREKKQ